MALIQNGLVKVSELKTEHFTFDEVAKKIGVAHGVADAQLVGSDLNIALDDGTKKVVPLADLVPAAKADIFLKDAVYRDTDKKLVLTTGVVGDTAQDKNIEVDIADLLPVATGTGISGNGTTSNPLTLNKTTVQNYAIEAATVTLQSAFGDNIMKGFPVA